MMICTPVRHLREKANVRQKVAAVGTGCFEHHRGYVEPSFPASGITCYGIPVGCEWELTKAYSLVMSDLQRGGGLLVARLLFLSASQ